MYSKFLVFTDLHVDIMHDAVARMAIIIEAAQKRGVEFILHLGDIMYPENAFMEKFAPEGMELRKEAWFLCDRDDEKVAIKEMLQNSNLKVYSVLGNHDMDACDKKTACLYWNMPAPYYSFIEGEVRFIVLDSNYIDCEMGYLDFKYCNYKHYSQQKTHFIPKDQLAWLEETIILSEEPCILLTHAALSDEFFGIRNTEAVWDIISRTNREKHHVIGAFNGHNHVDGLCVRRGVPFISINSASNIWIGHKYDAPHYSETLSRLYPHIRGTVPYYNPLYAIVTVDESGIFVEGTTSSFVGKTPQELGFAYNASYFPPTPLIQNRYLPLHPIDSEGKTDRFIY